MSKLAASSPITAVETRLPALRVETVTDYRSFLQLEPLWNRVAQEAALTHPFLEHVWARTWWECFGRGSSLHILVVKAGTTPVAIAPLMVSRIRLWGIPMTRLGFLYNEHVPRADFLIASRHEEVLPAIWEHLRREQSWDVLQLCQIAEGSPTFEAINALAHSQDLLTGTWTSGASPYIRVDRSWEEFFGGLQAKHRSNLRNRSKRLRSIGDVSVETVGRDEVMLCDIDQALRLESAAWKGQAGTAILCDDDVRTFYTMLARRTAHKGWCRLNFLRAGDRRIAFDLSLEYGNQIFLLKLGYDPEFAPYSPSNLLLMEVLERAFGNDIETYDFLGEFADWKRCWTSKGAQNRWLFVFSDSLKARILHALKFRLAPALRHQRLQAIRRVALRLIKPASVGRV